MSSVFIGQIIQVAFAGAPTGWAMCNGQTLSIDDYPDLFSVIGNVYGGDGVTEFKLPDLRGRVPVSAQDTGVGLMPIAVGDKGGSNCFSVTLSEANMPAHSHEISVDQDDLGVTTTLQANTGVTGLQNAASTGALLSSTPSGAPGAQMYLPSTSMPAGTVDLGGLTTVITGALSSTADSTGSGSPFSVHVMQPYLGLNYIIALTGDVPVIE